MGFRILATALAAIMFTAPAVSAPAAQGASNCPAEPVLPQDLARWAHISSNKTIFAYGEARAAEWPALGAARTELSLHGAESLRYWIAPDRKPDASKFGGMVPISVKESSRLVVALDARAWIDLVRDGAVVRSVGHGHGPICSGIRKMVEFDVTPGRYLLQIVDAPERSIRAMAAMR